MLRHAKLIPNERTHDPGTRWGYGVHNTRDLAISELCTVPGFNVMCADFWAGHEIDPLKYKEFYKTKPQYVDEQYRLAVPHLALLNPILSASTQEKERMQELEERLAKLEAIYTQRVTLDGFHGGSIYACTLQPRIKCVCQRHNMNQAGYSRAAGKRK